jgi:type IV pilus assembly protein PilV
MTRSASKLCALSRQSGIGMIEVLIAVLVVSMGFLGMAALQAKALSTNNSAMARSMATIASYSILDAMRTDLASAEGGVYNKTVTANACSDPGTSLSGLQLNAWCGQLGAALGAAATTTGTINCTILAMCTITIQFDDSRAGVGGSNQQKIVTRAAL